MGESTSIQIYKALKRKILSGEIPPERQLVETTLAEELKVSRTPIREAIFLLKKDRLVIQVPSGGVITRDISLELTDILGVRKALETYAVKLAIDLISPSQVVELDQLCAQAKALPPNEVELRARLNAEFHERIVAAAQNKRLYQMWLDCREYFVIAQESYAADFNGFHEHFGILDAIKSHDKELAEKLVNEHLDHSIAAVLRARASTMMKNRMDS